jgi:hypothetical protein
MLACCCWCTRVSATGKSAIRSELGPMVVEAKAMRCRDEGETRIGLGLEAVVNLYRRTGLGFGREVHVEWYSAGHPGTPEHGRGAGWDVSSSGSGTYAWGMDMGMGMGSSSTEHLDVGMGESVTSAACMLSAPVCLV